MLISKAVRRLLMPMRDAIEDLDIKFPAIEQQLQKNLMASYRSDKERGIRTFDDIADAGFRCYSQFEEDGILLYLLAAVGFSRRNVVEICCGHGRECMAANLIVNHGFKGYLFDGDSHNVQAATRFFGRQKDCLLLKPTITQTWITRDNINELLRSAGASGEVDVLSLDMDGNDYHIWKAIEEISPRICVFETHDMVPEGLALTIPYRDDFFAMDKTGPELDFRSVSLGAMVKLSKAKGYTLVGSHKHGFNVFFVRNDLMNDHLREVSIDEVQDNEWSRRSQRERWPQVKDMPWIEV